MEEDIAGSIYKVRQTIGSGGRIAERQTDKNGRPLQKTINFCTSDRSATKTADGLHEHPSSCAWKTSHADAQSQTAGTRRSRIALENLEGIAS